MEEKGLNVSIFFVAVADDGGAASSAKNNGSYVPSEEWFTFIR